MLCPSQEFTDLEKNICESEGRPRAAGSTSWIIGAQIRKLHESPIQESCPGTIHGPVKLFNTGREAFVSTDMPLATLSLGKYFRYQKIQFCETSQQFPATRRRCEHFPGNDTGGGLGSGGEANKQTGTILISRRDIPLPSSLGDCHAQVEAACIIAQSRRQHLRAASTQCISTTKYTRGTRHISTQYLRRVKMIHRCESTCIIAQSRRQNLRAASTQCISTTKYTRGTRYRSTQQYPRRVKLIYDYRSESMCRLLRNREDRTSEQ